MYNYSQFRLGAIPVSSVEEAKNAPLDLSGNINCYFNDTKNEVYLKQFNMTTGKTFFGTYAFVETPVEAQPKDEIAEINKKLDYLYQMLEEGVREDQPKKEKAVNDDK